FTWQHSELVLSRMEHAGWCPSDITMLDKLLTPSGMYFASLLPPRLRQKDHVAGGCNQEFCNVLNITEAARLDYCTEHTKDCDKNCGLHYVKEEELCEILSEEGAIAVVDFLPTGDDHPKLQVSAVTTVNRKPFVAISHVWVEGLGNVRDNALPRCQLVRIQALVHQVSGDTSMPFWLDTLCIPQDYSRPHLQAFRINAIKNMNRVYESSSAVLVLDSELGSTSIMASLEEQLVRFACSSWVRRLWTLNEAVLGTKVMLQLQDGTMDLFVDILQRLPNHPRFFELSQTLLTELADFPCRISLLRGKEDAPSITKLWNACQFRSTSEHQDEAMCLAILLGHDPTPIINAGVDEKWCLFLQAQKTFPFDLLFTKGPRVELDRYRWAPSSFI
ncbi:hypothetical protein A1O1_08771, partial [Capronia coronata CBS 617.96]